MDDAREVLRQLKKAKAPHRTLDIAIGLFVGYKKHIDEQAPPPPQGKEPKYYFTDPSGQMMKIPDYTRNLDEARKVAEFLMYGVPIAFSWKEEIYSAQLFNGPKVEAPDPALAVCTAAFEAYVMRI